MARARIMRDSNHKSLEPDFVYQPALLNEDEPERNVYFEKRMSNSDMAKLSNDDLIEFANNLLASRAPGMSGYSRELLRKLVNRPTPMGNMMRYG